MRTANGESGLPTHMLTNTIIFHLFRKSLNWFSSFFLLSGSLLNSTLQTAPSKAYKCTRQTFGYLSFNFRKAYSAPERISSSAEPIPTESSFFAISLPIFIMDANSAMFFSPQTTTVAHSYYRQFCRPLIHHIHKYNRSVLHRRARQTGYPPAHR